MNLRVGTSIVDITPPVGSPMAAFPRGPERTPRRAAGVLDPLLARAIAIDDGSSTVLLASVDVCMVRETSLCRVRRAVRRRLPELDEDRIVLAATHTHAGAETSFLFGASPDDPQVLEFEERIAGALIAALADRETVHLEWVLASLPLTHNRRVRTADGRSAMVLEHDPERTTGPVDPDLHALRFRRPDGTVKAVLYHYTAHALTLGPANDLYSADYPGRASGVIERACPGAVALFLNGAAGNVHPRQCMRADAAARDAMGDALGKAVLAALDRAVKVDAPAVRLHSAQLAFPNRHDPAMNVPVELALLRLGPLFFGIVPGEFFVEHQLRYREAIAPSPGTLIGYANGWPGYVPTREAYVEGGYGVDLATADPPRFSRTALPPGAGDAILERLLELYRADSSPP